MGEIIPFRLPPIEFIVPIGLEIAPLPSEPIVPIEDPIVPPIDPPIDPPIAPPPIEPIDPPIGPTMPAAIPPPPIVPAMEDKGPLAKELDIEPARGVLIGDSEPG